MAEKVLVSGGAGFIGSHLTEALLAKGYHVTVIDNLACGRKENLPAHKNLTFINRDICEPNSLRSCFHGIDWVFHLAGIADIVPSIENPSAYFKANVEGTLNMLELAHKTGVKRFIYAASSSSYGVPNTYPTAETAPINPQYPYALTKHMGEELVMHWEKVYKLPAVSLRLFNVYGPRSRTAGTYGAVFGVFLAQKKHGKPFTVVGDGTQTRDFTFVTDVAAAFICAAESDISGECLNVGSGDHYSVNKLVKLLGGKIVYIPKRPGEPDCTFADASKIHNLLKWEAKVSFEDGVRKMLENINDWQETPVWDPASIEKATEKWFRYLGKEKIDA